MTYTAWFEEIGKEDIALAGGKGANLGELSRAGLPVPSGFVVTTEAYDSFVEANGLRDRTVGIASRAEDPAGFEAAAEEIRKLLSGGKVPEALAREIRAAYHELEDGEAPVAVRSSATAEDLPGASFAGQQETYLNIRGARALVEAVRACWASLWTARAIAYRHRRRMDPAKVGVAVVVQRMVEAEAAGILFTADPASGRRDRVVINAAWGLGEAVVGGRVTPDTLVVDGASGRVVSRQTADKATMTVYGETGTEEKPVPEEKRRRPVLDDATAAELARCGKRIEGLYGAPQDIEWALAGGEIFVLQARPITALPAAEPSFDWAVPDPKGIYARGSIVELLPDPLTPLFATTGRRPVERTLRRLLGEILGENVLPEEGFGFVTINGYAYYYMRVTPRVLWRMALAVPGAEWSIVVREEGERRWREEFRPRYAAAVEGWGREPPDDLSAHDLAEGVEELLYRGVEYYTGVQIMIPSAYLGEALFDWFYNRFVRREGDPPSQTFLLGFDSAPIRAEKSLYDLAAWSRARPALAAALLETPPEDAPGLLAEDRPPDGVDDTDWGEWRRRFEGHLGRYGHMVYDLDFAKPVAADDPGPTFDTLKYFVRGEGRDPRERQREAAARRDEQARATLSRLRGPRRRVFRGLLLWAQKYAPLREDALAEVGLAWPSMRRMLLELGRRLAAAGAVERPGDVFWLEGDELRKAAGALDAGWTRLDDLSGQVRARKAAWQARKRATPPALLPKGAKFMGLGIDRWMPARSDEGPGDTIAGVGAGAGRVTGRARVLGGPEDFGAMRPGEVLVAGITTPAWTPLFAVASAVVTDVGGPLSHGSIVAREYGIPAVLGTGVATRRIRTGQTVRVDGDAGTVAILDGADGPTEGRTEEAEPEPHGPPGARRAALVALLGTVGAVAATALWRKRRRGRTA